jgi:hypothetical protein
MIIAIITVTPTSARGRIVETHDLQPRARGGHIAMLDNTAPVDRIQFADRAFDQRRDDVIDHDADRAALGRWAVERALLRNLDADLCAVSAYCGFCRSGPEVFRKQRHQRHGGNCACDIAPCSGAVCGHGNRDRCAVGPDGVAEQCQLQSRDHKQQA